MIILKNIKVNLKEELYNFYEWKIEDDIKELSSVPCIKLNNKTYLNLLNNKIKIKEELLSKLKTNICIFAGDYDTICILFDNTGKSIKYSKLLLNTERKIMPLILKEKPTKIEYENISKLNYSFLTRNTKDKLKTIKEYIIKNKNNKELIKYLYLEIFGIVDKDYNKLINEIDNLNKEKVENIFEIIEILV